MSKNRLKKLHSHVGKVKFTTKQEAENTMWKLKRTHLILGHSTRVYKCEFCTGWHWGHFRSKLINANK